VAPGRLAAGKWHIMRALLGSVAAHEELAMGEHMGARVVPALRTFSMSLGKYDQIIIT